MYICKNCQTKTKKWSGQCQDCKTWNSIILDENSKKVKKELKALSLNNIKNDENLYIPTSLPEFNNTLGGGIFKGSVVLLGGEPGIGKSTLVLQIANSFKNTKILYLCGEESDKQIKLRASRLKIDNPNILVLSETCIEDIIDYLKKSKIEIIILDSIHTAYSKEVNSEAGSISQIRTVTQKIITVLKPLNLTTIIIAQITKDGNIAGPKSLEHLVDTVLYLEPSHNSNYRILRPTKNRFAATDQICIFKMVNNGLQVIPNFNLELLPNFNIANSGSGTSFSLIMDGNKSFLIEVQSLVNKTVFGYPQRKTSGYDANKLQIISAVLNKFTSINVNTHDIHINLAGGVKSKDPAIDMAVCSAIISSYLNISIPTNTIILGEIGLNGQIKNIKNLDRKLKEAKSLGFKKAFIPEVQNKGLEINLDIVGVRDIKHLVEVLKK